MIKEIIYALVGVLVISYVSEWCLMRGDDPSEPKTLRSTIPVIGHLLNLIRHGSSYWAIAGKSTSLEIFSLRIFSAKLYISNTARLLPLVQKSSKTLSFRPIIQTVIKSHSNGSKEMYELFGTTLVDDLYYVHRNSLLPGPDLDEQNLRMAKRALVDVDDFARSKSLWLNQWVKHVVVQATSCGIFGTQHPYLDPSVEEAFWVWNDYLPQLLSRTDFTGAGHRAREVVQEGFRKQYRHQASDASRFTKDSRNLLSNAGLSEEDCIKQDSSTSTAAFPNTSPTLYWAIWDLFCRPDILEEVRQELEREAISGDKDDNGGFALSVVALRTKCPVLLSMLQETQRWRHRHATIRKVLDDTLLDGRYLLKKGSYLLIPGAVTHMEESMWGSAASTFDPRRFVRGSKTTTVELAQRNAEGTEKQEVKSSSTITDNDDDDNNDNGRRNIGKATSETAPPINGFVPWGNAPHLCPARQFASTEILIIVALLAMRIDMKPESGKWEQDPKQLKDFATINNPAQDVKMDITRRSRWEGNWTVEMGDSKASRLMLASG